MSEAFIRSPHCAHASPAFFLFLVPPAAPTALRCGDLLRRRWRDGVRGGRGRTGRGARTYIIIGMYGMYIHTLGGADVRYVLNAV